MLPEPGQGALAVEARADDAQMLELAQALEHPASRACVEAERSLLRALGGGCRVPIAAHASHHDGVLALEAAVLSPDGAKAVRGGLSGPLADAEAMGRHLADELAHRGAKEILQQTSRS